MSTTPCRLATIATMFAVLVAGPVAAQETYDLLGPAPKEGMTVASKSKMTMKKGNFGLKVQGMNIDGTMDMATDGTESRKILGVSEGKVTKVETRVLEGSISQVMTIFGQEQKQDMPNPLAGLTIISERTEDGWKNTLVDEVANDMQKAALDNLTPVPDQAAMYPDEKVAPGHTWEMKAAEWAAASGGMDMKNPEGNVKAKFVKVLDYNDEQCALIEQEIDMKGKVPMPGAGGELEMSLKGKATTHRSLKNGLDLKSVFEGEMTMGGAMNQGGQQLEISVSGKMTVEQEAELK